MAMAKQNRVAEANQAMEAAEEARQLAAAAGTTYTGSDGRIKWIAREELVICSWRKPSRS